MACRWALPTSHWLLKVARWLLPRTLAAATGYDTYIAAMYGVIGAHQGTGCDGKAALAPSASSAARGTAGHRNQQGHPPAVACNCLCARTAHHRRPGCAGGDLIILGGCHASEGRGQQGARLAQVVRRKQPLPDAGPRACSCPAAAHAPLDTAQPIHTSHARPCLLPQGCRLAAADCAGAVHRRLARGP